MTALTDEEVVQIARSAYAESLAAQGYPLIMVEKIMGGEASTSATHLAMIKWVELGIRAAAKLSGGAGEPYGWHYKFGPNGMWDFTQDAEYIAGIEAMPSRAAEYTIRPVYAATPPAEPPHPVDRVLADINGMPMAGGAFDPARKPEYIDPLPALNLHDAYKREREATPPHPHPRGGMEREGACQQRADGKEPCGDCYVLPDETCDMCPAKPTPAPVADDLVERLDQYAHVRWVSSYTYDLTKEAAARITADAAVIAGKDAEIAAFKAASMRQCARATEQSVAAEARITALTEQRDINARDLSVALNELAASRSMPETTIFDWLETEVSAIDTVYRGSPTYTHDAYWMKDTVFDLLNKAKKAFPNLESLVADKDAEIERLRTLVRTYNAVWNDDEDRITDLQAEVGRMTPQAMDNAPKDGKHCLLWVPEPSGFIYVVQGAFQDGQWNAVHKDNVQPIAWVPNLRLPDGFLAALNAGERDAG